jgi:hypothetical protein
MPTSSHLFYIPLVLLVGLILGVLLGRRSILVQQAEAERRRRLEDARAARLAARTTDRGEARAEVAPSAGSEAGGGDGG